MHLKYENKSISMLNQITVIVKKKLHMLCCYTPYSIIIQITPRIFKQKHISFKNKYLLFKKKSDSKTVT